MEKIELSVKLYKYGQYRRTDIESFNTVEDLEQYIKTAIEEDSDLRSCIDEDNECNEWEQSFEYNGKHYILAIDL